MVRKRVVVAAGLVTALAVSVGLGVARAASGDPHASHVLVISVDGMHESDLTWYVKNHPHSTLASLDENGVEFTNAQTTIPSDSYPGVVAPFTGGGPQSAGIYYDDTWNHGVFPAGTTDCDKPIPGAEVPYMEADDKDQTRLDAGQGLANELSNDNILKMTSNPDAVINPANLPVDPTSCQPIYPHSYLQVNTVFNVARNAGLRTAWSDKHPANEILDGPSGLGVNDFFTPEINSNNPGPPSFVAGDWTTDNAATIKYDGYKVDAVENWIDGFNHQHTAHPGTPAIFGMNFQTVSTAEKLPTSDGLTGGYVMQGGQLVPGPLLTRAFDFINDSLTSFVNHIDNDGLANSTVIILTAKHGQSPMNPADLIRIDDGAIITALNQAWCGCATPATPLVVFSSDDDGMLLWLSDRSSAATSFAKSFLENFSGTNGNNTTTTGIHFNHAGLAQVFAGDAAAHYFHVQPDDQRVPDIFGIAQYGVVYTGGTKKIAEHGGAHVDDLNVPLLVSGNPIGREVTDTGTVQTTQIAPTILNLLGLDPDLLQAVQLEHTAALNLH